MIAYKLKRKNVGGWIGGLVTPKQVSECIANEICSDEGLTIEELDTFIIEPYETTQEEIDSLPEFAGW